MSICGTDPLNKCLSAFGFWGTQTWGSTLGNAVEESQMPFGFWVLGNATPESLEGFIETASQMPFGFWVLGNTSR